MNTEFKVGDIVVSPDPTWLFPNYIWKIIRIDDKTITVSAKFSECSTIECNVSADKIMLRDTAQ